LSRLKRQSVAHSFGDEPQLKQSEQLRSPNRNKFSMRVECVKPAEFDFRVAHFDLEAAFA
jgi:hypothetical protein